MCVSLDLAWSTHSVGRSTVGIVSRCLVMAMVLGWTSQTVHADDETIVFNRDIRPLLADACFHCHGPDAKKREADLRLDDATSATSGDTPAIVRGKPDESELIQRIHSTDPDIVMPPPAANKTLTDKQKELLRRWIAAGAPYQKHWSFEAIPPAAQSLVAFQQRTNDPSLASRSPIDQFVLARLRAAELPVQPRADRMTLIRRVAFTLTGLPPTIAEIDAYLGDPSEQAYEHMVDRYLASSHFGEEMAKHWLDVARYADTHGLHLDNERQMWLYRDWVVRAFNDNLPFDQFTVWQIAGDQLPEATLDQQIATGFSRCNVTTSEGGAIDAEFTYRYAVERTSAMAQAWLGLTAGCAVCHDHKYDPLTSREFYSMYAFFLSAADPAMDGNINTTPPFLKVPSPNMQKKLAAIDEVEQQSRRWLETVSAQLAATYADPVQANPAGPANPIHEVLLDEVLPIGASSRSSSRNAVEWIIDPSFGTASGRRVIRQAQAAPYTDTFEFSLRPASIPERAIFEISVRVEPLSLPDSLRISGSGGGALTWSRQGNELVCSNQSPSATIRPGEWIRLEIAAGELGWKPGDRCTTLVLSQTGGIAYWDAIAIRGELTPANDPGLSLAAWHRSLNGKSPAAVPSELRALISANLDSIAPDDLQKLRAYYIGYVARAYHPEQAEAREAWDRARVAKIAADESVPGTFIFRDRTEPRDAFVMLRGQYDKPGDQVEPDVPSILPPIPKSTPTARRNRLDLARWLVANENPLTARVTVNRLWQQVFGTGIVKTSYDLGSQGEPPSHPELLDWLAADFRESGWNVKRFIKQLLMTEAFQRDATLVEAVRATDPANRLYARGPRIRLDAEQVRDNVLFVSGLIDMSMGGRGVNTYQPPNIWEPVGYSDSNTRFYLQDHGSALYRRSLYVFLKRTAPPPFMSNFDAPNREQVCTVRERSNTPLQALQLMNDVQHFEAARALAERVLADADATTEGRIRHLYRLVLAREPEADELTAVASALENQRALYVSSPESAQQAIAVGESPARGVADPIDTAAWTMICNLVLNLDETVNRN